VDARQQAAVAPFERFRLEGAAEDDALRFELEQRRIGLSDGDA
jgi:hypothetical protein